jgi:hypothetical protein
MKLSLPPFLLGRRFSRRHCCSGDRRLLVRAVCSVTADDDLGQTAAAAPACALVVGRKYTGTEEGPKICVVDRRGALWQSIVHSCLYSLFCF